MRYLFAGLLASLCLVGAAHGLSWERLQLNLQLQRLAHPFFSLEQVRLQLDASGSGELQLGRLVLMGRSWADVRLTCGELQLATGGFACRQGRLQLPGQAALALELRQRDGVWQLRLQPTPEETWLFTHDAQGRTALQLDNASPRLLQLMLPSLASLKLQGRFNGVLHGNAQSLSGQLKLQQGGYATADGLRAGEGLQLGLHLRGQRQAGVWQLQGELSWQAGLIYQDPVLLQAAGQRLSWSAAVDERGWQLRQGKLDWPQLGLLQAQAQGSWQALEMARLQLPEVQLQALGQILLQPWLQSRGLPHVDLAGRAGLQLHWATGAVQHLSLEAQNAGLVLEKGRLALEGLSGRVEWQAQSKQQSKQQSQQKSQHDEARDFDLQLARLALGRLETSAFTLPLRLKGSSLALRQPLHIPLLDGLVVVDHFNLAQQAAGGDWEGRLGLSLHPISLEQLTEALDLPPMVGRLSANLPAIRYARGEAALEGALVIQVFDGYLNCTHLRLVDPFGPLPRILADVEARHLDLGQLTQTFSFGQVTGFVDADLQELEIAAWRPLAFKARIASSPGNYPRRISQKAVQDITALGGGGAMAAIQGSFLRFFQDFGYERIGLSCRLENGVCHMGGIADEFAPASGASSQQGGYTIVAGGGIPALTVIGYNRAVHWDELIARLQAALANPTRPIIQ